jgi:peptidoglycan/LPS O-acetylase OafA/YrhL
VEQRKSIYLEYYRGIAALGVAMCHFFSAQGYIFGEYISTIFVEMFFPLSGFILAPQILKVCENHRQLKIFYLRRWIRTLPVYMLGLLSIALLTGHYGGWDIFKYAAFLNFLTPHYHQDNFYAVSWSLAVEEFYYLLFPLFLFYTKGNLFKKTLLLIGLSFIVKLLMAAFYDHQFIRIATFARLDAIGIGFYAYIALAEKKLPALGRKCLLLTPLFLLAVALHYLFYNNASVILFMYAANVYFALLCAWLFNSEGRRKVPFARMTRGIAHVIGSTSYSIYVFHIIILGLCLKFQAGLAVYMAATLLFSYSMFRFFERPLLEARPDYTFKTADRRTATEPVHVPIQSL